MEIQNKQQHNKIINISFIIIFVSTLYTLLFFITPIIIIQKHISQYPFTDIKKPSVNLNTNLNEKTLFATYSIVNIKGQNTYIALPLQIDNSKPIRIILYSHGSTTYINKDSNNEVFKFLTPFSAYYANNGYIFAASNEHSPAWGNDNAIQDMENTLDYILKTYNIEDYELNLIGYSMGGLSSMHYAWKHPDIVNSIALIAPTIRHYEWSKEEFKAISNIPTKIWHGTQDKNIPSTNSIEFITLAKKYNKNIQIKLLPLKDHWNIKLSLKKDIFEFLQ